MNGAWYLVRQGTVGLDGEPSALLDHDAAGNLRYARHRVPRGRTHTVKTSDAAPNLELQPLIDRLRARQRANAP